MTNKNTKRALLTSVMSLLLCFTMLLGTTYAWFTDSVSSANNLIVAGNLDVELKYAKVVDGQLTGWDTVDNKKVFDPNALWEPGRVEVVYLEVSNLGSLALKYQLGVNAEDTVIGKTADGKDIKLSQHLVFKVVEMPDALTTYTDREAVAVAAGTEKGVNDYNGKTTALEVGGVDYVALIVYMPETVGNEANYRGGKAPEISLGINLFATQMTTESDSFDNEYDADAWVDGFKVTTANDLQAALNNGETNIVVMNDIDLNESIVIPAAPSTRTLSTKAVPAGTVVINLNGKTINNSNGYAFESYGNVAFVGEGTVSGLGCIRARGGYVQIDGGNFYASSRWQDVTYQHTLKVENAVAVINGGNFDATVNGQSNAMFNASENGVITINGGSFKNVAGDLSMFDPYIFTYEKNGKLVINDGTFFGGWRFNGETATTDIYGGTFTVGYDGQSFHADSTHKVTVYGGTFVSATNAKLTGKVAELVAEGYKAVESNGAYTVLFPQESFEDLLNNAEENATIDVPAGDFTFPSSKLKAGMTLNCDEDTVFTGVSSLNANGATVVGATFSNPNGYVTNSTTVNGTFKDCTFIGKNALRYCYAGNTVVFEDCVFTATSVYAIHFDGTEGKDILFKNCKITGWVAIAGGQNSLVFDGCEIYGNGTYGLIRVYGNTTIKNCVFDVDNVNTSDGFQEGIHAVGCTVNVENCTNVNGAIQDILNISSGGSIIVDGIECVTTLAALQEKLNAATGDLTIGLAKNLAGDLTVVQKPDVKLTIEGNGYTFSGTITVDGKSARYETAALTIQNLNFNAESISADAYINLGQKNNDNTRYTNNVTVQNCVFSGINDASVAIKSYTGGDWNLTVEGCVANKGVHSLLQVTNVEKNLKVIDCKIYSKNGINLNNTPSLEMSGCTFDVTGYAIRLGVAGDANAEQKNFTIANSTLKSACAESDDAVIVFRGNATNAKLTLTNTTLDGSVEFLGNTDATIIEK